MAGVNCRWHDIIRALNFIGGSGPGWILDVFSRSADVPMERSVIRVVPFFIQSWNENAPIWRSSIAAWRDLEMMQFHDGNRPPPPAMNAVSEEDLPGWALGLRKLYWAVSKEPIPSEFADLLARLDGRSARGPSH